jgi:hypothetical protein
MTGQFNDLVRVVAFNTLEHWADDVSKDVAQEIQARCDIAGEPVPEHVEDFVATYAGRMRQTGVATGLKRGRQLRRLYSPIRAKLNILDWRPGLYSDGP